MKPELNNAQRGFTLIEAVVVIAITGIVAAVVAVFIRVPVEGYFDSVYRAELTDVADTALRRMARDLRLALPNSMRVNGGGTAVEFLLTTSGGRYLDQEDDPAGEFLDFDDVDDLTFDVVGPVPASLVGNQIVVYNLGPSFSPGDAYTGGNRATVNSISGQTATLAANPFASQTPEMRSPGRRFQVVTTPVTYACLNNQLIRYSNYPISSGQPDVPVAGAASSVMANGVTDCAFNYNNAVSMRTALIGLSISLTRNGETVQLFHQVHVDNTP